MDFFTKGYNVLRGDKGQLQSPTETIDRLVDRCAHSTMLEDRRAAVLALKGVSRQWKKDVGEGGLHALARVLDQDREDIETTRAVLETLEILCSKDTLSNPEADSGVEYTKIFISNSSNVTVCLDVLKDYDFYVRFNTVKLLGTLLTNAPERLQECVLTSPYGMSRLTDLLDDRREIIRNEGMLLLISLTETNADIQKIVAFENAFERLLAIIDEEEGISGGIIVQDCLQLIHNLLRYNVSNQNYFRETSCIQRIPRLLGYVGDNTADSIGFSLEDWPTQKISNTVMVLELVRILTVPGNQNTIINQAVMHQSGIVKPILQLGLCSNAPARVKTEALYAISDLMLGNRTIQDTFSTTIVGTPPKINKSVSEPEATDDELPTDIAAGIPRPAVVSLIAVAVAADLYMEYTFATRAAATYAFECFVQENADAQIVLAATFVEPPGDNPDSESDDRPFSAGSLLLRSLLEWETAKDPYVVWFASVLFSHILRGNDDCKKIAGKISFGDQDKGEEPIPLIHQLIANLMMASREHTTNVRIPVAYLTLLNTWLYESPLSVTSFLSEGIHVQFLIEQIHKSSSIDPAVQGLSALLLGIIYMFDDDPDSPMPRKTLQPLLLTRVGADQFASKVKRLREVDAFRKAEKLLQISPEEEAKGGLPNLLFDYTFVEFFKQIQDITQRSISQDPASFSKSNRINATGASSSDESDLIQSYKDTIQRQELEINDLKTKISTLEDTLKNQNSSTSTQMLSSGVSETEIKALKETMAKKDLDNHELRAKVYRLEETLKQKLPPPPSSSTEALEAQIQSLSEALQKKDLDNHELRARTSKLDEALRQQQQQLSLQQQQQQSPAQPNNIFETKIQSLNETLQQKEREIQELKIQNTRLDEALRQEMESVSNLESQVQTERARFATLEKEQEDLLVLMGEQDIALKKYKIRLRDLGQEVSEDEEDTEDDSGV